MWNFVKIVEIYWKKEWFFSKTFDSSHLKFEKTKKAKIKNLHFRRPVNCKSSFFINRI